MKLFFATSLFVILANASQAQSLSYKSESSVEGMPAMVAKMSKTNGQVYCKNNKTKTVTKTMSYTQTQITDEEKVTIQNTAEPNCVVITKAELKEDSVVNTMYVKNVKVLTSSEFKKISGYNCTKTTITYAIANTDAKAADFDCELVLWCSKEVVLPHTAKTTLEITKQNALTKAMASVEGFPIQSETLMKANGMKTIVTISEISTKELSDAVFQPDQKACKKPMNLKEYNQFLLKQNRKPTGWL